MMFVLTVLGIVVSCLVVAFAITTIALAIGNKQ